MDFHKYSKIENTYRAKGVQQAYDAMEKLSPEPCMWIATEKVDGANFGIWYDVEKDEVRYSKRSAFLGNKASFFDWQNVVDEEAYRAFFHYVMSVYDELGHDRPEYIVIFGELFGHGIQRRISYSGGNQFVAFDLYTDTDGFCCPAGVLYQKLSEFGIQTAPGVAVGTLYEMMAIDVESVKSTFSESGDYAEGIVIKPYDCVLYTSNGRRCIFKKKAKKFSEGKAKSRGSKPENTTQLTEYNKAMYNEIRELINMNRLLGVVSKEGDIPDGENSGKHFGRYMGLLTQDAIADYEDDMTMSLKEAVNSSDNKQWKTFSKVLNAASSDVVREWIKQK